MTILIQSRPSAGAAALRAAIREQGYAVRRRLPDSTRTLRRSSFLVNWGCSRSMFEHLNKASAVGPCVNKLLFFSRIASRMDADVRVPVWETSKQELKEDRQNIWLARHSLFGSGGEGITVVRPGDEIPDAPLYVEYIPKLVEFRVHAFRNLNGGGYETLTRQKLRETNAILDRDQRLIRNHDNGWVFGLVRDEEGAAKAEAEAKKAVAAIGLDFGAVDVIIGRDDGLAYVLEVNTAPGLEAEATLDFYATNIINAYNNWRQT